MMGCDGGPIADRAALNGDYNLVALQGRPMPALYDSAEVAEVRVTSGVVRLAADGTYREEFVWVHTRFADGASAETRHARWGTWVAGRGRIHFTSGETGLSARVEDGRMWYSYDGKSFVFVR